MYNGTLLEMNVSRRCLCDLERVHRKQKVLKGVMKYWLCLFGTDETNLFADTMEEQRKERGNTGMNRIEQELERLGSERYLGEW
jgi:hypothetical protein